MPLLLLPLLIKLLLHNNQRSHTTPPANKPLAAVHLPSPPSRTSRKTPTS
jgi:hypothetical protein